MPIYKYKTTVNGKVQSGEIEAENEQGALSKLKQKNIKVTRVKKKFESAFLSNKKPITEREATSIIQMTPEMRITKAITTSVALLSWSRSGQVTLPNSSQHSSMKSRVSLIFAPIAICYFVSLCAVCVLHRGQYLRCSTRSGCKRLFFFVL